MTNETPHVTVFGSQRGGKHQQSPYMREVERERLRDLMDDEDADREYRRFLYRDPPEDTEDGGVL